ncbi:hypothetical protein Ddc_09568 [Ditylenchus destructor]|nr:hypothetical protein Ddc_09568 [Ditylenchus destructor]
MVGFKLAPGPVPENYRLFDLNDGLSQELLAMGVQEPSSSTYQEFGKNFNDAEEVKEKHRKKMKRSLDDLEGLLC